MNVPGRGGEPISRPRPGPARPPGGLEPLDGHFALSTTPKETFITATGGGGHTTDAIHTDATVPRSWEWFRLWAEEGSDFYALQTIDGHFVTAVDAGGRTADTIHTDAIAVASWELFRLPKAALPFGDSSGFNVETTRGFYLTAVGGGGHNSGDTIHTDATVPNTTGSSWERFLLWRGSQFGTGSTYGILVYGANDSDESGFQGWMVANGGGGWPASPPSAVLFMEEGNSAELSWTLLKQSDGTYALQTANGTVLSAVGGGVPGAGFTSDTPVDSIGNAEKFTLEDQGDFTVCIKTFDGTYISLGPEGSEWVGSESYINRALKFRLQVFDLAPGPTG